MDCEPRLILASASPRRLALLGQLGMACQVFSVDIPEFPQTGESPEDFVVRMAAEKSLAGQQRCPMGQVLPVLAADTEVVLDGEIFGKPTDRTHAASMLMRLSDREHRVLSAVCLRLGECSLAALSTSMVRFRPLTSGEIDAYWESGEPQGKAGGYAIQGLGAIFVSHLSGSYSGVMGLPLHETASLLSRIGLNPLNSLQAAGGAVPS